MSKESEEFLRNRGQLSQVEYTKLAGALPDGGIDQGVASALAKFRPHDTRTIQIEMLEPGEEYVIYDYPNQHEFGNWDQDQHGAKAYVLRKLRATKMDGGEPAVQEVFHVLEALLHNYSIVNVDLLAEHKGHKRPQCHVPLGLNRALRETLGEF